MEGPFHAFMNALTASFPALKGQSFKPNWKTLTVGDKDGRWYGRVLYKRAANKKHTQLVSTAGDWECHILIPEELYDKVLTVWAHQWDDQRRKQYDQTNAEEVAFAQLSKMPDYDSRRYSGILSKGR